MGRRRRRFRSFLIIQERAKEAQGISRVSVDECEGCLGPGLVERHEGPRPAPRAHQHEGEARYGRVEAAHEHVAGGEGVDFGNGVEGGERAVHLPGVGFRVQGLGVSLRSRV